MQKIVILDFGSQTTQLIGRRIREMGTFCEIFPYDKFPVDEEEIIGVILSGSPLSVYASDSFHPDLSPIIGKYPVLGICYGAQLLSYAYGGKVESVGTREYGRANLNYVDWTSRLFKGIGQGAQIWMSHGDSITSIPKGYRRVASTDNVHFAAFESTELPVWGVQFHPEVAHTLIGTRLLENFVVDICGSRNEWTTKSFIDKTIEQLKSELGNEKVILGVSGGIDSSVTAALLNRAVGSNLTCVVVDNGLLRKNEFTSVLDDYKSLGFNIVGVDASEQFYSDLTGVTDPEQKRQIIGRDFVKVFEDVAARIGDVKWLAQGTIYPDCIESLNITGKTIKTHHNVGGLPKDMALKLCEPLRWLFKDEVRDVGRRLGLPEHLVGRHSFPGCGLGVRIMGEVTAEKIKVAQAADEIFIKGLREWNLYDKVWQAGAILLQEKTVGVMGDERTFENALALRAVTSVDGMTADWAELPYEFLKHISNEIINKVKGVNRVCYDISSKPPATIEWE